MRTIKFRVWDWYSMDYNPSIWFVEGTYTYNINDIFSIYKDPPMQSTWLFDKNGKEIYEGDIIRNWFYDDDRTMVVEKDEDFSGFNISYRLQECIINTDTREVIGNIYENPDLVN